MGRIQHSTVIPAPLDQVFAFASDYNNRVLIIPQEVLQVELTGPAEPMAKGVHYELQVTRFGIKYPLEYVIEDFQDQVQFVERQVSGVFEEWLHTVKFEKHSEESTLLTNIVQFKLPLGLIGTLLDDLFARNDLEKLIVKSQENIKNHFTKV